MREKPDPQPCPRFGRAQPDEAATLDFPELSTAEFQRLLRAANGPDADPAVGLRLRPSLRALLVLALLLLVGAPLLLMASIGGGATELASRITRLQLEVCRGVHAVHHMPSEFP
ncbi:MAG TPA: hypothetical protein VN845_08520, partial [Solirubrobacteraceae bacterium]|nr:hypothetical protein [Solirubrobacteraceae bacterium]